MKNIRECVINKTLKTVLSKREEQDKNYGQQNTIVTLVEFCSVIDLRLI